MYSDVLFKVPSGIHWQRAGRYHDFHHHSSPSPVFEPILIRRCLVLFCLYMQVVYSFHSNDTGFAVMASQSVCDGARTLYFPARMPFPKAQTITQAVWRHHYDFGNFFSLKPRDCSAPSSTPSTARAQPSAPKEEGLEAFLRLVGATLDERTRAVECYKKADEDITMAVNLYYDEKKVRMNVTLAFFCEVGYDDSFHACPLFAHPSGRSRKQVEVMLPNMMGMEAGKSRCVFLQADVV